MRAFVDAIHRGQVRLLLGPDESVAVTIPTAWLSSGIREGMVLQLDDRIDHEATAAGKAAVQELMDSLGDNP